MDSPEQPKAAKRIRSANWVQDEELILVALYRDYDGVKESRRVRWENLATQLASRGPFSARKGASLEQKWANLTQVGWRLFLCSPAAPSATHWLQGPPPPQTYRAITSHDLTRSGPNAFYNLKPASRKQLLQEWKVNSLEPLVFQALDECMRTTGACTTTAPSPRYCLAFTVPVLQRVVGPPPCKAQP
jgi:hypothetical protein